MPWLTRDGFPNCGVPDPPLTLPLWLRSQATCDESNTHSNFSAVMVGFASKAEEELQVREGSSAGLPLLRASAPRSKGIELRLALPQQELRARNRNTVAELKSLAEFYGENYTEDEPTRVIHTVMQFLTLFDRICKEVVAKQKAEKRKEELEKKKKKDMKHSASAPELPSPSSKDAPKPRSKLQPLELGESKPVAKYGRVLGDDEAEAPSSAGVPAAPSSDPPGAASSSTETKSGAEPQEATEAPAAEKGASEATGVAGRTAAEEPGPPKQQQQQQPGKTTPRPAAISVSDTDAAPVESGGSSPAAVPSWAAPDKIESVIMSGLESAQKHKATLPEPSQIRIDCSADPFGSGRGADALLTPPSAERGGSSGPEQGPDALDFSSAKKMLQNKLKPKGQRAPEEAAEQSEVVRAAAKPEEATREANGENGDAKQGQDKQQEEEGEDKIDFGSMKSLLEGKLKFRGGGGGGSRPAAKEAREGISAQEAQTPKATPAAESLDSTGPSRSTDAGSPGPKPEGKSSDDEDGINFGSVKNLLEGKLKFRGGGSLPAVLGPKKDAPAGSKAPETTPPTTSQGPRDEVPTRTEDTNASEAKAEGGDSINFGSVKNILEGKLKFRGGSSEPKKDAPAGRKAPDTTPPTTSEAPRDKALAQIEDKHASGSDAEDEDNINFGSVKNILEGKLKFRGGGPPAAPPPPAKFKAEPKAAAPAAEPQKGPEPLRASPNKQAAPVPPAPPSLSSAKLPPLQPQALPPLRVGNDLAPPLPSEPQPSKLTPTTDGGSRPGTAFHSAETSPLPVAVPEANSACEDSVDDDAFVTPSSAMSPEADAASSFAQNKAALESSLGAIFGKR